MCGGARAGAGGRGRLVGGLRRRGRGVERGRGGGGKGGVLAGVRASVCVCVFLFLYYRVNHGSFVLKFLG